MLLPRSRTRQLDAGVAVLCFALVTSCASRSPHSGTPTSTAPSSAPASLPTEVRASGVARADAGSVSTTALVNGTTAFGHDLYVEAAKAGGNVVISPLSIEVALAMARAGAAGTTAAEIDAVMHFPVDQRDAAVNALTRTLATRESAPPLASPAASRSAGAPAQDPIVTIANGMFVQQGFPIGAAFLRTIAADYGAGVRTVDFGSASAKAEIDAWVKTQTAGRIKQLFDSLDPDTKLVLANAVYLKADWAVPFAEDPTTDAPFTTADGKQITVPTMHQGDTGGYAHSADWQAVALPYAGGTLAMWVIVPTGTTPLADLLSPTTLAQIKTGLQPASVQLALPRWTSTTNLNLVPALEQLGMHAAFSPAAADFSGISAGLYIQQAVHRATINVDEWGTEAAAVTGLAFAASSKSAVVTVKADHPFAYAIVSVPTGAVVFEGSVADPTAG